MHYDQLMIFFLSLSLVLTPSKASCATNSATCTPFGPLSNTSVPFPPQSSSDYSVIGPPLQAVHSSSNPPTGLAIDPNLTLYLTYPRRTGRISNNVVSCPTYDVEEPWPNSDIQNCYPEKNASECFINVQNVVLDSLNQLWIVDSGIPAGQIAPVKYGAKIMSFDWQTKAMKKTYIIPEGLHYGMLNLNDLRLNNTLGTGGYAFITDASAGGSLLSINLDTGEVLRRLYNTSVTRADDKYVGVYNGEPVYTWNGSKKSYLTVGADGIALASGNVYWGVLASRRWYYIPQESLADKSASESEVLAAVIFPSQCGSEQAGLTADDKGRVYITASEQNAIFYVDTQQSQVNKLGNSILPSGIIPVKPENYVIKTLVRSALIQHADSAAIWDGWLYFCTNQLGLGPGLQHGNVDRRKGPYLSYRVWVGAGPAV